MFIWFQETEDTWQWPCSGERKGSPNFCHFHRTKSQRDDVISEHSTGRVPGFCLTKPLNLPFGNKGHSSKWHSAATSVFMCIGLCQLILNDSLCHETVPSNKFLAQAKSWRQKPGRRAPVLPAGHSDTVLWKHKGFDSLSSAAQTGSYRPPATRKRHDPCAPQPRLLHPFPSASPSARFGGSHL